MSQKTITYRGSGQCSGPDKQPKGNVPSWKDEMEGSINARGDHESVERIDKNKNKNKSTDGTKPPSVVSSTLCSIGTLIDIDIPTR